MGCKPSSPCDVRWQITEAVLGSTTAGAILGPLGVPQIFKPYCGAGGSCYQCCGGNGNGCWTSFVGFPVINCPYPTLGGEPKGLARVNGAVGGYCIGANQTCNYIAACQTQGEKSYAPTIFVPKSMVQEREPKASDLDELIDIFPDDPDYELVRLGSYFSGLARDSSNMIDNWLETSDTSVNVIDDSISQRGCRGWRQGFENDTWLKEFVEDYTTYRGTSGIDDADELAALAKLYKLRAAVVAFGSVPNIVERHGFIESRVFSEEAKDIYLEKIESSPDEELSKYMSPQLLELVSQSTYVQDYRLLAVPLEDEPVTSSFNGCSLDKTQSVTAIEDRIEGNVVTLRLQHDPALSTEDLSLTALLINWGDGTTTRQESLSGLTTEINHSYSESGNYPIAVTIQNSGGLRDITFIPAAISDATTLRSKAQPTFSELNIRGIRITEPSLRPPHFNLILAGFHSDTPETVATFGHSLEIKLTQGETAIDQAIGRNESSLPADTLMLIPIESKVSRLLAKGTSTIEIDSIELLHNSFFQEQSVSFKPTAEEVTICYRTSEDLSDPMCISQTERNSIILEENPEHLKLPIRERLDLGLDGKQIYY